MMHFQSISAKKDLCKIRKTGSHFNWSIQSYLHRHSHVSRKRYVSKLKSIQKTKLHVIIMSDILLVGIKSMQKAKFQQSDIKACLTLFCFNCPSNYERSLLRTDILREQKFYETIDHQKDSFS
ncbi:hypothetical protein AQUCO_03600075v1 [Aquilegia coerulea]|uniref:Uncharacterized protein n=1 Tax=Aquilegia coerulea TaxID=218851 RepID=A0A2G5CW95_AQUCA|nr:hypothetical protein AQUCO_03600075v1 [Aquilegia coerulea]